jgi:hypothetical protein
MFDFEAQYDELRHNVVGIRFTTPIPWPKWEGGGVASEPFVRTQIEAGLSGNGESTEKERDDAKEKLGDLAGEIDVTLESALSSAQTMNPEIREKLVEVREAIRYAAALIEKVGQKVSPYGGESYTLLQAKDEALRSLLNLDNLNALGDAISLLDAQKGRLATACTDLDKEAEKAKAWLRGET